MNEQSGLQHIMQHSEGYYSLILVQVNSNLLCTRHRLSPGNAQIGRDTSTSTWTAMPFELNLAEATYSWPRYEVQSSRALYHICTEYKYKKKVKVR